MAQIEYIKYLREIKGLSINKIAKKLKVNWRTVKKYAEREEWNVEVVEKEKTYPVLGNYLDVIDIWLAEDSRSRNKKQHHTNRRIFHRLRDECGYTGGERTVTTYVAKKKRQMATAGDSYTKLLHPGGEADQREANLFFHLVNHLYERSSLILTSNKSPDQWGELLGDDGITTAILDRLLHRVEIIQMNEDSYRMKHRKTMF